MDHSSIYITCRLSVSKDKSVKKRSEKCAVRMINWLVIILRYCDGKCVRGR